MVKNEFGRREREFIKDFVKEHLVISHHIFTDYYLL